MLTVANSTSVTAAIINDLARLSQDCPSLAEAINGRLERLWPIYNDRKFSTELRAAAGQVLAESGAKLEAAIQNDGVLKVVIVGELLHVPPGFHEGLAKAAAVELEINCLGGCSAVAFEIIDGLQNSGKPVRTHIANAASAGALLAQAGTHRTMQKNGLLVLHRATSCRMGDEAELLAGIDSLRVTNTQILDLLVQRTGRDVETVSSWLIGGLDSIFDAPRALAAGLVDAIED